MTDKIVVLSTCGSEEEAEIMARHLVDSRLAACVNIVPGINSVYRWNNKVESASEWLLLIKSRRHLSEALKAEIEKIHKYEVPEMVVLTVTDGAEPYLNWIDAQLTS